MSSPRQWFLFDFFQALRRETNMGLELRQYWIFLQCYHYYGLREKQDVLFLCKTVWLHKAKFELEFERLFEIAYNKLAVEKKSAAMQAPPDLPEESMAEAFPDAFGDPPAAMDPGEPPVPAAAPPAEAVQPDSPEAALKTIHIRIENAGGQGSDPDGQPVPLTSGFVLSDYKYLPFDQRAMEHGWRKVKGRTRYKPTQKLDVPSMIRQKGKNGVIKELIYQKEYIGEQKIVWFSDHGGSMIPFSYWDNQLFEIVRNVPNTDKVEHYFFHDYPSVFETTEGDLLKRDYLFFRNRSFTQSEPLSRILRQIDKNTIVLIFSDGGAARKHPDEERVDIFYEVIEALRKKTPYIGWINPVKNLDKSPAKYISFFVKTAYASNKGVQKLLWSLQNR